MKGINYRVLMNNWDTIVDKICDEMTPHDVLDVIAQHIQRNIKECQKNNISHSHLTSCHEKIIQAMNHINPNSE